MRKITVVMIFFLIILTHSVLVSRANLQIVEVSVCEESVLLAELVAKSNVSRKQLYSVSYCDCQGIHASYRTDQTIGDCKPPKNRLYSCNCLGRTDY